MNVSVGITLLFSVTKGDVLTGIAKSFAIKVPQISERHIREKTLAIARREQRTIGVNFIGISDLYSVSGSSEGAVLGRTSYFEMSRRKDGEKMITQPHQYSFANDKSQKKIYAYNFNAVFFNNAANRKDRFILTVLSVVGLKRYEAAISKAKKIVRSKAFKQEIAITSLDDIMAKNLEFLGFNDFCPVFQDCMRGWAYQTLQNDKLKSIQALKRQCLSKKIFSKKVAVLNEKINYD